MKKYKNILGRRAAYCYAAFSILALFLIAFLGSTLGATDESASLGTLGLGLAGLVGLNNRGRTINDLTGISGVAAGGNALINLPVNVRYHRIVLNVTDGGAAAAVGSVITGVKLVVNGISVRDITPGQIIAIAQANGYLPKLGELPLFFTEPYARNVVEPGDATAWDMDGQNSFQILLTFAGGTVPAVTGWYEFDHLENTISTPEGKRKLLQIVSMHSLSQAVAIGANDITVIPTNWPIRRLWFASVTANAISSIEIKQDGNTVFEATRAQMLQMYGAYGFKLQHEHHAPFQNATGPANLALDADFEALDYFDFAYIADVDSRLWKALRVAQSLKVRVTSTAAENLSIIVESVPGIYA